MSASKPLHSMRSLAGDLEALGVDAGDSVIVHSSLKAIGRVVGGPTAVVLALERCLTSRGNLVMPTFSEHLCDPVENQAAYAEEVRDFARANMPLFHPDLTPVDKVNGFLTEVFRKQDGVLRSGHPHVSFAAWGKDARHIVRDQPLSYALGPGSPLGKLYELKGSVLLLGAPKDAVTALHLAEYEVEKLRHPGKKWTAKIARDGEEEWVPYMDVENNSDFFPAILDAYIQAGGAHSTGRFGDAESWRLPVVELVDFGVQWMKVNR